jgi:hypothetical protein
MENRYGPGGVKVAGENIHHKQISVKSITRDNTHRIQILSIALKSDLKGFYYFSTTRMEFRDHQSLRRVSVDWPAVPARPWSTTRPSASVAMPSTSANAAPQGRAVR